MAVIVRPITTLSNTALPSVFSAAKRLPSPRRMDIRAPAPMPTIAPKAEQIFIIGIVTAIPAIAAPPTPWPTKTLSIIWYIDDEAIAIIAGTAYRNSSEPRLSVPNDSVLLLLLIFGCKYTKSYPIVATMCPSTLRTRISIGAEPFIEPRNRPFVRSASMIESSRVMSSMPRRWSL